MIEEALRAGVRLVTSYGLTESSSLVTATAPGDPPEALHTAGRTLAFRQLSVAADGEILVRGRTLFRGYVEGSTLRPSRNASGWFPTGDLAHIDDEDYLFIEGRGDDTIIRGGENVAPAEIETVLLRHPAVAECAVVGLPDEEWGQRIAAVVVASDDATEADLQAWCHEHLRGSKTPDHIEFRAELPYTDTGKLLRRTLRDELTAD
jgi:acyl-CoA synthetase (AMP-forming)/AMP-acid ligase II